MPKLVLRPNQLLTRRDLIILAPPKSLLLAGKPWGNTKEILYEHGFRIRSLIIPYQVKTLILQKNYAKALSNKHLFIDENNYLLTSTFWNNQFPENSTLTILQNKNTQDHFKLCFKKQPPNLWNQLITMFLLKFDLFPDFQKSISIYTQKLTEENIDLLLSHCQHLAELDFNQD